MELPVVLLPFLGAGPVASGHALLHAGQAMVGGDDAAVVPAALASLGCFLLNAVLIRYLYLMERGRR